MNDIITIENIDLMKENQKIVNSYITLLFGMVML